MKSWIKPFKHTCGFVLLQYTLKTERRNEIKRTSLLLLAFCFSSFSMRREGGSRAERFRSSRLAKAFHWIEVKEHYLTKVFQRSNELREKIDHNRRRKTAMTNGQLLDWCNGCSTLKTPKIKENNLKKSLIFYMETKENNSKREGYLKSAGWCAGDFLKRGKIFQVEKLVTNGGSVGVVPSSWYYLNKTDNSIVKSLLHIK